MSGEYKVSMEEVEQFLHGRGDEEYIVAIEYDYNTNTIYKVIHDPIKGKGTITDNSFEAFCWVKDLPEFKTDFYINKKDSPTLDPSVRHSRIRQAKVPHGITMELLDDHGN